MKKILLVLLFVSLMMAPLAQADTIIFPYINDNPGNVSTIISVINGTGTIGTTNIPALHYRYLTKTHTAAAIDPCIEWNFYRPTSENDLVSFDVSASVGDGKALFGDPGAGFDSTTMLQRTYNAGVNAPFFHDLTTPKPRRGYLLVSHAASMTGPDVRTEAPLDGEAVLFDIVNGAAWGYRAGLNTSGDYVFATSDEILVENGYSFYENTMIMPPNQFTQRYFVTPIFKGNTGLAPATGDMTEFAAARQKRTRFGLYGWGSTATLLGMFDRNEQFVSGGSLVHVRCVAAIDLPTLVGTGTVSTTGKAGGALDAIGGWATVDLHDPVGIIADGETAGTISGGHDAFVYDLKFGNFTGFSGMINDGKVIRTRAGQPRP